MDSSTGMPGTLTDVLACTLDGVVSDAKIWVPMLSVVEFVKLPASPEEATTVVVIVAVCMYVMYVINTKRKTLRKTTRICTTPSKHELTFAGLHTLDEAVFKFVVGGGTSTFRIPSTTRSATTDSSGFRVLAAL